MGNSRRSITKDFKEEAVRLLTEGRFNIARVAHDLGIRDTILDRWKQELALRPDCVFLSKGQGHPKQEKQRWLRRDNMRLRLERDIKGRGHPLENFPMRCRFIQNYPEVFPATLLCQILKVNTSGVLYATGTSIESTIPVEPTLTVGD